MKTETKKGFLYILLLKNKEAFKVGITDNEDLIRINNLSRIYEFDLDESFIVETTKNRTTKSMERQIHADYKMFSYDIEPKADGHTEFIKFEHLNYILEEIEFKSRLKHLGVKIKKGINANNLFKTKVVKPKKRNFTNNKNNRK